MKRCQERQANCDDFREPISKVICDLEKNPLENRESGTWGTSVTAPRSVDVGSKLPSSRKLLCALLLLASTELLNAPYPGTHAIFQGTPAPPWRKPCRQDSGVPTFSLRNGGLFKMALFPPPHPSPGSIYTRRPRDLSFR